MLQRGPVGVMVADAKRRTAMSDATDSLDLRCLRLPRSIPELA